MHIKSAFSSEGIKLLFFIITITFLNEKNEENNKEENQTELTKT